MLKHDESSAEAAQRPKGASTWQQAWEDMSVSWNRYSKTRSTRRKEELDGLAENELRELCPEYLYGTYAYQLARVIVDIECEERSER